MMEAGIVGCGEGSMIRIQNELLAHELMGAIIDLNEQQQKV